MNSAVHFFSRCRTCPRLPSDQVTWICCRQSNQDDGFIIGTCGQCHVGRSLLTWASTWHWIYTASAYIYIIIYIYQVVALFFRNSLFRRTSLFILYVFGEQLLSSLASIWRGTWMHNVDLLTTQCSIYHIIHHFMSYHRMLHYMNLQIMHIYIIYLYIWANYNISLTWNKAILG